MLSLMDRYSNEEFTNIVLNSYSYRECLQKMGYVSQSGNSTNRLKEKIKSLNIDVSHFTSKTPMIRTQENVFIENSTASQKVLREWYKKGEYTPYKCAICGQEPFWHGKELTLILDHINGYNKDDRLENLRWVCPNCNYQLDTTNGKNINHKNHNVTFCIDCVQPISKGSTRCMKCSVKFRTSEEVKGVSREQLKDLIRNNSFVSIGKKYNVSDNAVRKWCKKYNLPFKATEIKNYSDEEWLKI